MVAMPEPRRAESTSDSTGPSTVGCMRSPSLTPAPRRARYPGPRALTSPANRGECPEVSPLRFGDAAHGEVPRLAARDLGVIRDQILAALRRALDAAGFPEPAGGVELTPPTPGRARRLHHQRRLRLTKSRRPAAARRRGQDRRRSSRPSTPPHVERVEVAGPGFINFYLAPTWLHDVLRGGRRAGRAVRARPRARRAAASTSSSSRPNPTGPLHAGGGRWVAVGDAIANLLAAQGAEVHREYYLNDAGHPARHLRRVAASPATAGEEPPDDGYQGEYLVEMADRMRAELGDDVTEEQAREWGYREVVEALAARPRSHRRALRHVVLGAHAARERRRSPRCSTTSRDAGVVVRARRRHLAAHHRLRRPARPRAREVRRRHHLPLQRPRVPPRQVRARVGAPHRHLGRRPPRPGEVAAGRAWRRSGTRPASPR